MTPTSNPVICVVIGRTRHKMMQAEIEEAGKQGARLIELRLDYLSRTPDFKRLLEIKPCPMIATMRRISDGGRWSGKEEERLMVLRHAVAAGFDWIDLETDQADKIRRFGKTRRLISYHNFKEVPADLEKIHARMCDQDADVVKLAVTAQKPADNLRVLEMIRNSKKPTVAHCMGDIGICSRVLSAQMGAPFTYGAFNPERSFAPGLLTFQDLKNIYHFEQITPLTSVYGVIGDPVVQSFSPLVHNRGMRAKGINGVYLPFRVPRGELEEFLKAFDPLAVQGYSVTIPHKEAAAKLAQFKDKSVDLIGAANTLIRVPDGWMAYNTDAPAALEALEANLPPVADGRQVSLKERLVFILGAGGVARAVGHALHQKGVSLIISNRTFARAQELADEFTCRAVEWNGRHNVLCDILINCTSVGMYPNMDESPIHHSYLKPGLMVFDTIYHPETTMLIREAKSRGCHVLTGVEMFVRQAGLQFKLFTGQAPPLDLMAKLVRQALSPVARTEDDEG